MKIRRTFPNYAVAALIIYVGSYAMLSRYSLALARREGLEGFFYAPASPSSIARDGRLEKLHVIGIYFYFPVWLIDYAFGGPKYSTIPLTEIDSEARTGE